MTSSNFPSSIFPYQASFAVDLGIGGLPELSSTMMGGGIYALKAATPSARFPLLIGSLASALASGLTCSVILQSKPELFVQRIELFGNIDAAQLIEAGRLHIFVMQAEFAKTVFRYGADGFVHELEQFAVPENSYLIFDQADELLSLHDMSMALDQVDVLGKWFGQRGVTGLLVFSRATDEHVSTINALMDNLTGVARLGGGQEGLEITFDYWQSPVGTLVARTYRLEVLESGYYEASTQIMPQNGTMAPALGDRRDDRRATDSPSTLSQDEGADAAQYFFYMDPALSSLSSQVPGIWQQVESLAGMLYATRNTHSPTVIIDFQLDIPLRQLAETVHTLRQRLGSRAQIVVREKAVALPYQNEALLLRLGINQVIHRDVPIARLPLLLESLKGQVFTRNVDINFEAALTSVMPIQLRGYLPPARFDREVRLFLERAETLRIPSVLIVGKPATGTAVLDVLRSAKLLSDGDLTTSNGQSCCIFLSACPPHVMQTTLNAILGVSAQTLLRDVQFWTRREDIQSELTTLLSASDGDALPDFSFLVGVPTQPESVTASLAGVPDSVKTPALASASKPAGPATDARVFRYNASSDTPAVGTQVVRRATRSGAAYDKTIS